MTLMEFNSEMKYPFIMLPVKIEEMQLKPLAHRVYTRIAYRAFGKSSQGYFETQENMSKAIFISVRQIRRELKFLEQCRMIKIIVRGKSKTGHYLSNLITVLDISQWMNPIAKFEDNIHRTHSPSATGLTVRHN